MKRRKRSKRKMPPHVRALLARLKKSKRGARRSKRNPPKQLAFEYAKRPTPPRGVANLIAWHNKNAKRRARRRRRSPSKASPAGTLHVTRLGKAKSLTYTHCVNGVLYRHKFTGKAPTVAYSRDGKMVIWPVKIQPFIGD